jgi:multiple sugar transport system substrate-binding protein
MVHSGQVALGQNWDEFFPGLDADGSKVKGLWEPAKPLTAKALRPASEAGFNEQPNLGHQGGPCISLSKYS